MTAAQPRAVRELIPTEAPATGWSDLGEPLAEAAVLGSLPSAYCADPAHNAASAFRARRAAQQPNSDSDQAGERPASLAGLRLRSVAAPGA